MALPIDEKHKILGLDILQFDILPNVSFKKINITRN